MTRLVSGLFLAIAMVTVWWLFRGVPEPVTTAMDDALWAPCPPRYGLAQTPGDSQLADGYILKPRSRFSKAITCGSERRRREAAAARNR
ncbi:hypothetical protein [Gemmatimonas sp.]|jgi:hypothetical protein|uniref:hypothetical protein n=1 Tax=Gemmatimonas sp. TaxID=1962908 RepID=UPI0037BF29C3